MYMAMSMTGYGRSERVVGETTISVEVRAVNHRFLDTSMKIPRSLLFMEEKLKKIIQSYFHRGRVEIFISIYGNELITQRLKVNWDLLEQYINSLHQIKEKYCLEGNIPIEKVADFDGVYSIHEDDSVDNEINEAIMNCLTIACRQVVDMRAIEGRQLINDIVKRNDFIEQLVKQLGEQREIVIIEYRERILKRIKEYIAGDLENDDSKIYQDIAILAEKGDITEEVTRLGSHLVQFNKTIHQEGSIGRKLDFIVQEMHREANTVGSKSNNAKISEIVVTLKSEIEKLKEQIQNIE